jgi:hypothetical protein
MAFFSVTNWLYFFNMAMFFYGIWAIYDPNSLINSFSGGKADMLFDSCGTTRVVVTDSNSRINHMQMVKNSDTAGVIIAEVTKRLGVVYIFFAIISSVLVYHSNKSENCKLIQTTICLIYAAYSCALCVLISRDQTFWATDGVEKNIPFVLINLLFAYITQRSRYVYQNRWTGL